MKKFTWRDISPGIMGLIFFAILTLGFVFCQPAAAFEPGGRITAKVGVETGSDLSKGSTGDIQAEVEVVLDPHQLFRITGTGSTRWNDGTYSKVVELDEVGVFVMPVRGGSFWFIDSIDVGAGIETSGVIDGRTKLAVESSNEYWYGLLTEIKY